jgi:predicted secreted hydrolase
MSNKTPKFNLSTSNFLTYCSSRFEERTSKGRKIRGRKMNFGFLFLSLFALGVLAAEPATSDGFAIPQAHRAFVFPRDHASHPEFRTEWWYLTGHLDAADGDRFGFQVTFFRQASVVKGEQVFLAHCALLNTKGQTFLHEERLNRAGWDAGASTTELHVHNGNWSLRRVGDELRVEATVRSDAKLSLRLTPTKPLVVFGTDGVSRKGKSPTAASHYLTWPRLQVQGAINDQAVKGTAWMDHEFSSSQLDEGQVGWDWACLQLNDGREVMVYRMRRADGSSDPAGSTWAWIDASGKVTQVGADAFAWEALSTWTSPHSKVRYPVQAKLTQGAESFTLRPLHEAQELRGEVTGLPYWEGACDVLDAKGVIVGRAFLELAGYAGDLAGRLRGR